MSSLRQSPADSAYGKFLELREDKVLATFGSKALTEADTRAKLIDPLFRDVLGWSESEIRREAPAAKGFADYVLGAGFAYLLVEAKRSTPRFQMVVASRARRLQLSGPHLLGNKKIKPLLEQAKTYASDIGAQFAIVTNGSQFIVFKPYLPGRAWSAGLAIVWHDHRDILDDFAVFFDLLSRDRVCAGSLLEAFEGVDGLTMQLYAARDYLDNPDAELVRNRFWTKISQVMAPLLADWPEDAETQKEVIENCYVTTPLTDEADESLNKLLQHSMPQYLKDAGAKEIKLHKGAGNVFSHKIDDDIKMARAQTYILTGGVGSGKTTFLKRFAHVTNRTFVETYCVWLHIDFLPIGNVEPERHDIEIKRFAYSKIRETLSRRYPTYLPQTGEEVRDLFNGEIQKASLTKLHGVSKESHEWQLQVNELVDSLFSDDSVFCHALLGRLRQRGFRTVIVLDNTDQLGESFQERVFLFSQKLAREYGALAIVALREEKFFAAYRRGIFDAYGDRRFHIGSPDLKEVIVRRLEYGRRKFARLAREGSIEVTDVELSEIDRSLDALISGTTTRNDGIVRMLACVSNGDMRHALDMFSAFVSSGNTDIEKILALVDRGFKYIVPFHEFVKSSILGARKFYGRTVSHIVNVFVQSEAYRASHFTACRVLGRLSAAQAIASPHGEGFVDMQTLLREYRESFGIADDFINWCGELLRRDLVESEPPRVGQVLKADALRITAAGAYYWKYLIRSFAYIDLVYFDTPLSEEAIARKLSTFAHSVSMQDRFKRVRTFLRYLIEKEREELLQAAQRSGAYRDAIAEDLLKDVENEIRSMRRRVEVKRRPISALASTEWHLGDSAVAAARHQWQSTEEDAS